MASREGAAEPQAPHRDLGHPVRWLTQRLRAGRGRPPEAQLVIFGGADGSVRGVKSGILRLGLGRTFQPVPGQDCLGVWGSLEKVLWGPAFSRPVTVTLGPAAPLALAVWVGETAGALPSHGPGEREDSP